MPRKLKNRSFESQLHMKTAYMYVHVYMYSVSPKGWYYGTPPPFNFKVYAEIQCFTTKLNITVQTSCAPPPFSLPREKHCTCTCIYYKCTTQTLHVHVVYIIYITDIFTHYVYYMYMYNVYMCMQCYNMYMYVHVHVHVHVFQY